MIVALAVIDVFYVGILAFHADFDPLGSPHTHALGLQFGQGNAAGATGEAVDAFLRHIFLFPEKRAGPLNGDAPGFFFNHYNHLLSIIQQVAEKRKMKNY